MLLGMPEGPGQMFRIAVEHDKFSLGSFGLRWPSRPSGWCWSTAWSSTCRTSASTRTTSSAYIASRSDREARKSVWLGGLLYVPVSAVFFLIGTALFA